MGEIGGFGESSKKDHLKSSGFEFERDQIGFCKDSIELCDIVI